MPSPFAMAVPVGGSNCAKCMYSAKDRCHNLQFVEAEAGFKKHGDDHFIDPDSGKEMPANQYCCNFFDWYDKPKGPTPKLKKKPWKAEK